MFEYINYLSNKTELVNKMQAVRKHFVELSDMEIDVSDSLKKIDTAIELVQKDNLSITLVGAFSDGKTSVVAGWLNEKVDNMKISTDESSDEILCYVPQSLPKGCQIIDTPGLFGDKIGNDENGESIVLSEKTKKYISEANIILYVVTAKNPIKDSHKACIRWILNDLNKLSSTIFVINRLDDVVDLTDEEEFKRQERIKTDTLRTKLAECGISPKQAEKTKVICISAAPDGKDIDQWKNFREEYLKRSHLTALESATNEILQNSREELITKTGCDILNDELRKVLEEINRQENDIDEIIIPEKKESLRRNQKDLEKLIKRIKQSREDIRDDLKKLNKNKISAIRAATMDNFKDVIEDEIGIVPGKEGNVLSEEITSIYNRYSELYSNWSVDLGEKFQAEYEKQNKTIENLVKIGANGTAVGAKGAANLGVNVFKQAIFAGRDFLKNFGIVIKFKPWQVVKLANFTAKALPLIGGAIDLLTNIIENVSVSKRQHEFDKKKDEIKNAINEAFIECNENLKDDEWFFENFAPGVNILKGQVEEDEKDISKIVAQKDKFMTLVKTLNSREISII